MARVTIHEAKTNLSELIRRVEAGEEIIIARGDKPVAILKDIKREEIAAKRAAGFGVEAGTYPPVPDDVLFGPMSDDEIVGMFGPDYLDLLKSESKDRA